MTPIEKLYNNLESSFIFDKKHDNILAILEALFGLAAGGFIGSIIQSYNRHNCLFAIIFSILFYIFSLDATQRKNIFQLQLWVN